VSAIVRHFSYAELEARLDEIRGAPRDLGRLEMIVRRPSSGERETLAAAKLSCEHGLVGDRWRAGANGRADQLTLMSARVSRATSCTSTST
jgi:hypothetical protein